MPAPVRLGTLLLLTNAVAMEGEPLDCDAALDAWDEFRRDLRTVEMSAAGPAHDLHLRKFVAGREPSPNLRADAWRAAAAECENAGLTSFDAGFCEFKLRDFDLLKP